MPDRTKKGKVNGKPQLRSTTSGVHYVDPSELLRSERGKKEIDKTNRLAARIIERQHVSEEGADK